MTIAGTTDRDTARNFGLGPCRSSFRSSSHSHLLKALFSNHILPSQHAYPLRFVVTLLVGTSRHFIPWSRRLEEKQAK